MLSNALLLCGCVIILLFPSTAQAQESYSGDLRNPTTGEETSVALTIDNDTVTHCQTQEECRTFEAETDTTGALIWTLEVGTQTDDTGATFDTTYVWILSPGLLSRKLDFGEHLLNTEIAMDELRHRADGLLTLHYPSTHDGQARCLQRLLIHNGFDVGAVDGVVGPATRAQAAAFSDAHPELSLPTLGETSSVFTYRKWCDALRKTTP